MLTQDIVTSTATTTIDLEAAAALDAALPWASPGAVWTELARPVESSVRQEDRLRSGKGATP
jgi:hypothetical protein